MILDDIATLVHVRAHELGERAELIAEFEQAGEGSSSRVELDTIIDELRFLVVVIERLAGGTKVVA